MKYCPKCKTDKENIDFPKNRSAKSGLGSVCKLCNAENVRKHYANKEVKYSDAIKQRALEYLAKLRNKLNTIKTKSGCIVCGENDVNCLDFHHVFEEEKEEHVSSLLRKKSIKRLEKEIRKCIVLCSNCHRKFHGKTLDIPQELILRKLEENTKLSIIDKVGVEAL